MKLSQKLIIGDLYDIIDYCPQIVIEYGFSIFNGHDKEKYWHSTNKTTKEKIYKFRKILKFYSLKINENFHLYARDLDYNGYGCYNFKDINGCDLLEYQKKGKK